MAIALVAHAGGTGSGKTATSASMNTTGATLLVAIASTYGGSEVTWTFSDSKSNANWTSLTKQFNASYNPQIQMAYCYGLTSVGSGHTVSAEGSTYTNDGYVCITVFAFSGTDTTSAVFNVESGTIAASSVTSIATGSLTPSSGDVLVCGMGFVYNAATPTISDSITILDSPQWSVSSTYQSYSAYKLNPGASSINPTWSYSDTTYPRPVVAATFKAGEGAPPATGVWVLAY